MRWSVSSDYIAVVDTADFDGYEGDPADADAFTAFLEVDGSDELVEMSNSNHWVETDDDVVVEAVDFH